MYLERETKDKDREKSDEKVRERRWEKQRGRERVWKRESAEKVRVGDFSLCDSLKAAWLKNSALKELWISQMGELCYRKP